MSFWLLTPLRVNKRSPLLKRTYELFGLLLTTMDSDGKNGSKSAERTSPTALTIVGVNTTRDRTALLRCSVSQWVGPMAWLSQILKEFDTGSKERTAIELEALVRCLWLSGVYDQLNGPNLCCLEEITRRGCQLVEAHESGAHGKPNWASVKVVHQCAIKLRHSAGMSCMLRNRKPRGKGKKGRAAAGDSCCGRSMNTNPASAGQPSDPGSTGPKWVAEEQHGVPLFNTVLEVPTLVSSHVPRNSCARLRQRMFSAKNVTSHAVLNL